MGKKYLPGFIFILFIAVIINSCKQATEPVDNNTNTGAGIVLLKGLVVDSTSNSPLADAVVKIINGTDESQVITDSKGVFEKSISIDAAKQITLTASKEGYKTVSVSAQVTGGSSYDVPAFKLHVENFAVLNGLVVDSNSGNAISGAVIRVVITGSGEVQTITDAKGQYSATVPIDKSKQVYLIAVKEGYYADSTSVYATIGRTIDIPLVKLKIRNSTNVQSGNPASIYLVSQSVQSIGVKESGSVESAVLVWEVQDSSGLPIDAQHAVTMNFKVGVTPGGGEYVSPASATTNALGRVTLNISSGTKAGVLQLIAEVKTTNKTISSKPVSIAVHGGLPDQAHFSLGPEKLNVPVPSFGTPVKVTAFVADKYANPVRPKTAVYFTSDQCYIEGSALTDAMGQGAVKLIYANPVPVDGFAYFTATSADENYNLVKAQSRVLFSWAPILNVTPTAVNIPHMGSQSFDLTLQDLNGNPMAEGTSIQVTAEGTNLVLYGKTEVKLPDTQSKAWTQFSFTVASIDTSSLSRPVTLKINTTGPNGEVKLSLFGTAH